MKHTREKYPQSQKITADCAFSHVWVLHQHLVIDVSDQVEICKYGSLLHKKFSFKVWI